MPRDSACLLTLHVHALHAGWKLNSWTYMSYSKRCHGDLAHGFEGGLPNGSSVRTDHYCHSLRGAVPSLCVSTDSLNVPFHVLIQDQVIKTIVCVRLSESLCLGHRWNIGIPGICQGVPYVGSLCVIANASHGKLVLAIRAALSL